VSHILSRPPKKSTPTNRQLLLFSLTANKYQRFRPMLAHQRPVGIEYRDISGFLGYQVGNDGSVWSQWKLGSTRRLGTNYRQLHLGDNGDGYAVVKLYQEIGKGQMRKVHRLILEAFVGPCPPNQEVRHLNDIKTDNRHSNLCYGTRSANQLDRHGRGCLRGEAHPQAKLTEADVHFIRDAKKTETNYRKLARQLGVSRQTITKIVNRQTWKHIV